MNILSLPATLALTINVSIALRVLMDRPRSVAHQLFFAFIMGFAVWNVGEILMINSETYGVAVLGAHLISFGFYLSPALFLLITFYFPRRNRHVWPYRLLTPLVPAIPVAILVVALPQPMMRIMHVPELGNIHFHALPSLRLWPVQTLVAIETLYLAWGVRNLAVSLREARSLRERTQTRLLIVGFLVIELVALGTHLLHSAFSMHRSFFFLSAALSIVISGFLAITVLRYGLVNVRSMVRQGVIYALLSAVILALYFVLLRHAAAGISEAFNVHTTVIEGAAIVLVVLLVRPLHEVISQFLEPVLSSRRAELRGRIEGFRQEILACTDFHSLLDRVEAFLTSASGSTNVGIFIQQANAGEFLLRSHGAESEVQLSQESPLFRLAGEGVRPVETEDVREEIAGDETIKSLDTMGFSYLFPFRVDGARSGFIALSKPEDRLDFSVDEIELFTLAADDVGIALSRVITLEEVHAKEARLRQAEKLAALGQLIAGIAHEVRNPLNVISSSAQTLTRKKLSEEDRKRVSQFIIDETEALNDLLTDFLQLARPRQPMPSTGRVRDLIEAVGQRVKPRCEERGVELSVQSIDAEVEADFQMLEQVLLNLSINAVEAMPDGGTLTLTANARRPSWLTLGVRDTGRGIPPEVQPRLFEPFFTTKETGTGLGLSIVYTLVETFGGTVEYTTGKSGTTFSVHVPIEG